MTLSEILARLKTELKPVRYPSGEKYADEIVIVGKKKAAQQIEKELLSLPALQDEPYKKLEECPHCLAYQYSCGCNHARELLRNDITKQIKEFCRKEK